MEDVSAKFTVFFDPPFWVGVYERQEGEMLEACRIIFGVEPKDYEVFEFLLHNWHKLRFSPKIENPGLKPEKYNPKRMQRQIHRQMARQGWEAGTKAQQALKAQQEQGKADRKKRARQQREEQKQYLFELRQQKKKQKHLGH